MEQAIEAAVNVFKDMLEANSGNSFLTDEQVMALALMAAQHELKE